MDVILQADVTRTMDDKYEINNLTRGEGSQ